MLFQSIAKWRFFEIEVIKHNLGEKKKKGFVSSLIALLKYVVKRSLQT